jgi:polyferredoxin
VGVCPTGVDIRIGMSEGCITCGMCIDACDQVMEKVGRPKGLIRYMSAKEMAGQVLPPLWKRPRVLVYSSILILAFSGIIYGLTHIPPVELSIVHERQPLFVQMKDGSIQNKYTIKAVNKTSEDIFIRLTVDGIPDLVVSAGDGEELVLKSGKMIPFHVFIRAMPEHLKNKKTPIDFVIAGTAPSNLRLEYESVFVGPVSGSR